MSAAPVEWSRRAIERRSFYKVIGLSPKDAAEAFRAEVRGRAALAERLGAEVAATARVKVYHEDDGPRVTIALADEGLSDDDREALQHEFGAKRTSSFA